MDIVLDAVKKLQDILLHSGCEDGPVVPRVNPDTVPCQYEKGACMEVCFGGKTGEFVTYSPIRATTKVEFMFGAPLDSPAPRGAACAILNVVTAFLCLSRTVRACPASCHAACMQDLKRRTGTGRVFPVGSIPSLEHEMNQFIAEDPGSADIILINGEGTIEPGTGDIVSKYRETKTVILLGPSTAGIASLEKIERFCLYGT
ncbi:MAG: hypothetical protein NTW33_04725 [Methanoregula sp.]|nr:hypothetical protein [Methanoregula sp.]